MQLLGRVRQAKALSNSRGAGSDHDLAAIGGHLAAMGYTVAIRNGNGGFSSDHMQAGSLRCTLRHSFLCVYDYNCGDSDPYIIETHLRDQFRVAATSPALDRLLAALPAEFVGKRTKLIALVTLVCHEVATAFQLNATPVPPWRNKWSILSKWFPASSRDTILGTNGCSVSAQRPRSETNAARSAVAGPDFKRGAASSELALPAVRLDSCAPLDVQPRHFPAKMEVDSYSSSSLDSQAGETTSCVTWATMY